MNKTNLLVLTMIITTAILLHGCNTTNKSEETEEQTTEQTKKETVNDQQAEPTLNTATAKVKPNTDQVMQAALEGDINVVGSALQSDFDVNTVDVNKRTLLMLAAFNGHKSIVKMLIDKGADVNMRDEINRTALMFASTGPFAPTVEILLQAGAKPNITDNEQDWTAAMMAASEGQLENLKILVANGADLKMVDVDGESSLDFARANQHLYVVEYIESQL